MLPWIHHRWTGLCLLIMGLGGFMLFLYGFFPLKYQTGKMSHMDDLPNFIEGVSIDGQQVYNSGENTVILMVIDGLRYDFVTEEYMPYTGQMLKNKSACIYVTLAEPPTVTMPRIKAMMTGSVSTFADVALNFGAPEVRGDSVVRSAVARGRRTVMYGDDTWLRLFPGLWAEYDGTTSFYVTDYTEVDNNVTRHLDKALTPDDKKQPSFDFLVLHYLGLDHIGHLEGARSPKIKPKLIEMDDVIKKIVTAMMKWDRTGVLIVCGDHGMRDAGGHGGASPSEVLVPLVLFNTDDLECPHAAGQGPTVAQVDVAPSIAWLLNAPPPADSIGRVLPALLPTDVRQHLYLLHVLAANNLRLSCPGDTDFFRQFQRAEQHFAHFLVTGQHSAAMIAKDFYEDSLDKMAEQLTAATDGFDMFAMDTAIFLIYFSAGSLLFLTIYTFQPDDILMETISYNQRRYTKVTFVRFLIVFAIITSILTTACFLSETKSQLCSFDSLWFVVFLSVSCVFTMTYFIIKIAIEKSKDLAPLKDLNTMDFLLIAGTVFHAWSFLGTSFIEEEHMTWYFFWNTLMFFVLIRTIVVVVMYFNKKWTGATEVQDKPELEQRMSAVGIGIVPMWILLIALHRYLRTMNQTGDRWMFLPDTADWLNAPENAFYLQAHLVIGTIMTLAICIWNLRHMNNILHIHTAFTTAAVISILCYRIASKTLDSPFDAIKTWDSVDIVNVFWAILIAQFAFEILTYIRVFRSCGLETIDRDTQNSNKFVYNKLKEKSEDDFYDPSMEEPWNIDEVKLNLATSISHLMLNDLMLIIVLLMRPHNVVMVPSAIVTCALTYKCLDHKLLDSKSVRRTEVVDVMGRTLVHMWIGMVFYFYQGNSNSLASVDLGSGYVGLREYCPLRVALRMGIHTYAGPALAGAALFTSIATHADSWEEYLNTTWRATNILALHRLYVVVVYCMVAMMFRSHLFVWSVFSPKLLYDLVAIVFTVQALGTIAQIQVITHITSYLARIFTYKSMM